jgi:hypothetical protein
MLDCLLVCLIDASGGFDHYPTGRDLVILGYHWQSNSGRGVSGLSEAPSLGWLPVPHSRHSTVELAIGTCRHHLPMVASGGHPCQRQSASTRPSARAERLLNGCPLKVKPVRGQPQAANDGQERPDPEDFTHLAMPHALEAQPQSDHDKRWGYDEPNHSPCLVSHCPTTTPEIGSKGSIA